MARALKGQLNIEVPNRIGFQHDPDKEYGKQYGADKLAEQQRHYIDERRCTCESPVYPDKWGVRYGHKLPCPRAGRKF